MHIFLSIFRFRSLVSPNGHWLPWVLWFAVLFAALAGLFYLAADKTASGIEARLHRQVAPAQGDPVGLGQTVELERGEKIYYSLRLKADCRRLQLKVDGEVIRILLNGRELGMAEAKVDSVGPGKNRVEIALNGELGEVPRLDLWLVATEGIATLTVANRAGYVLSALHQLCVIGGGVLLLVAAIVMYRRWRETLRRRLLVLSAVVSEWARPYARRLGLITVGLAIAVAGVYVFYEAQILPYDVTVQVGDGKATQVTLPHNGSSPNGQISTYRGAFDYGLLTGSKIKLVPDDRLVGFSINDNVVDLSSVEQWKLGDWGGGFELDIDDYLIGGKNTFEVQVLNLSDPFGLSFRTAPSSAGYISGLLVVGSGLSLFLFGIGRCLGIRNGILALLMVATVLRVLYLGYTGPYERSYDVGGHLEHMWYILNDHALPDSRACWECHQPSSYYLLSAASYLLGQRMPIPDPVSMLVGLSLMFDLFFLLISALFFQELCGRWALRACILLFFWPSGILNSIRINNDAPMYTFAAAALFFGLRWTRTQTSRDICWSALFTALVTITKISGLFVLPMIFCLWLIVGFRQKSFGQAWLWKQTAAAAAIILLGFGILYVDKFRSRWDMTESERITPIVHTIDGSLRVENKFRNYWIFDLKDFLEEPYTHSRDDQGGRQFLLNFFLKSSLFGEFHHYKPYAQVYVAHALKVALLVLLAAFLAGIFSILRLGPPALLLGAGIVFPFASLVYFRMNLPFSCNQDFRYIYPILLAFIPLTLSGLDEASVFIGKPLTWVGRWLCLIWMFLSLVFFVMPYFAS